MNNNTSRIKRTKGQTCCHSKWKIKGAINCGFAMALFGFTIQPLFALVHPNGLFCDNAVLQQGMEVPVWGTANDGEVVTVEIDGQKVAATAQNGRWMVRLHPLKVGGPYTLAITGENKITLKNILVGEVWICSGQSNMQRPLGLWSHQLPIDNYQAEAAAARYPEIRHFKVAEKFAETRQTDLVGEWQVCDPQTVLKFTAVGYFFGSELYKSKKVPIGLINASVGGTLAEAWTSADFIEKELPKITADFNRAIADYPAALEKYKAQEPTILEKWQKDCVIAQQQGKPSPNKPGPPKNPRAGNTRLGSLFNAMINPLQPFAIRGVIWYQGEANQGRAKQYQTLFPALIKNWRQGWNQGDFPFLFVQIPSCKAYNPEIREAQFLSWKSTTNTAMAVIVDAGDPEDGHSPHKRPVGERLALAARALAYGEKLEYSGPAFEALKIEGHQAVLSFTHCGTGLVAKDGVLRGFEMAGEDGKYRQAQAEIKGNTVMVSQEAIPKPVAVRYAWANVPEVSLYNQEGLPASPFRTNP